MIPFNKPYITGKEFHYIYDAVATGKMSGNGKYSDVPEILRGLKLYSNALRLYGKTNSAWQSFIKSSEYL